MVRRAMAITSRLDSWYVEKRSMFLMPGLRSPFFVLIRAATAFRQPDQRLSKALKATKENKNELHIHTYPNFGKTTFRSIGDIRKLILMLLVVSCHRG